jgi:hypothetical protein
VSIGPEWAIQRMLLRAGGWPPGAHMLSGTSGAECGLAPKCRAFPHPPGRPAAPRRRPDSSARPARAGEEHIEATDEPCSESALFRVKGRVLISGDSPDPHGPPPGTCGHSAPGASRNAKLLELPPPFSPRISPNIAETCTALERVPRCAPVPNRHRSPRTSRGRALVGSECTGAMTTDPEVQREKGSAFKPSFARHCARRVHRWLD